jgi:hypothetical protein
MMEMKVLVACETSGTVRDAFEWAGHDAWSCDLLPADTPTNKHLQGDVREVIGWDDWDMLVVAHPPCTRLCNSGARWLKKPPANRTLKELWDELDEGAALFREMMDADVPLICVENPVMHHHAKKRIWPGDDWEKMSADDGTFVRTTVQPWQFAESKDAEDYQKKRTCLWLKGLPPLVPTNDFDGKDARDDCHKEPPSAERWKNRSKFHKGLAQAMADQWGGLFQQQMAA